MVPNFHQNLISSSLYHLGPLHKSSLQSIHNFLRIVAHTQTDRQTNKQTIATENITSFAKEVINKKIQKKIKRIVRVLTDKIFENYPWGKLTSYVINTHGKNKLPCDVFYHLECQWLRNQLPELSGCITTLTVRNTPWGQLSIKVWQGPWPT